MPATLEVRHKIYGKIIRIANQPQVGPHWQAKYQMMQTIRVTCRSVIKNPLVHSPILTLVRFIKYNNRKINYLQYFKNLYI